MRTCNRSVLTAFAVICSFLAVGRGMAADRDHDWVKLGQRKVDASLEKDVIEVGREEGRFVSLRIKVDDGDLVLRQMRVVFAEGSDFTPELRHEFKEGSRSHEIDLPGRARVIRRIEFVYKSEKRHDKAVLSVYGRRP